MLKKIFVSFLILPVLTLSTAGAALAETVEITISGNGSSSDNSATVQVTSATTVTQANEVNVDNNVSNNANTGDNSASANNGSETTIETGNVSSSTDVSNANVNNNSAADCNCIQNSTEINIIGNGAYSANSVNVSNNSTANVDQSNNANITNQIVTNANTGGNSANKNLGNVGIYTGNITALTNVSNKNINNNFIVGFGQLTNKVTLNVLANGAASDNVIALNINNLFNYSSNNEFNLANLVWQNLNTGDNTAAGNSGNVAIHTGDIKSEVNVNNSGNNNNLVAVCPIDKPENPQNGEKNNPPAGNPGNGGGPSSSGGTGGTVLGAVATGSILPETGAIWLLLATLIASSLFLMGWYLRFSTGVSPPVRI